MLNFFPTPYPDEWWYSILCRYYVRTGYGSTGIVKEELFHGNSKACVGSLFPNVSVYQVLSQLPRGIYDIQHVILTHTLFLYFTRIYSLKDRIALLNNLCAGAGQTPTHLLKAPDRSQRVLRWCPLCAYEDRKQYGEAYWHVGHQIPIATVCQRHGCRLVQSNISAMRSTEMSQIFSPLETIYKPVSPDFNVKPWERIASLNADYYLRMPLSVSPIYGENNLIQILQNTGYRKIYPKQNAVSIDREKLYIALCEYYGADFIRQYFGDRISPQVMSSITSWKQLSPERYILLQTMAGIHPDEMFIPQQADLLREKMEEMASGGFYTEKAVAEALGVRVSELYTLSREYNIPNFWQKPRKPSPGVRKTKSINFRVFTDEYEQIRKASVEAGYKGVGTYILQCVHYAMDRGKGNN